MKPLFRRLTQILLMVGLCLVLGLASPAIATPLSPSEPDLLPTVDQFLQEIPRGYYSIRQIDALKRQLKEGNTVLIDVREPSEYRAGHIDGAINIPLRSLAQNRDQIPRDQPVVLYCSTGYRTGMGVMALHLLGYGNVQGFPPSYEGWKQMEGSE